MKHVTVKRFKLLLKMNSGSYEKYVSLMVILHIETCGMGLF
jgi:hypothetical protein